MWPLRTVEEANAHFLGERGDGGVARGAMGTVAWLPRERLQLRGEGCAARSACPVSFLHLVEELHRDPESTSRGRDKENRASCLRSNLAPRPRASA